MDGGDWVTLIVSVVTIMVSVFGAHELVKHQDKTRATAKLLAKLYADVKIFQDKVDCFCHYVREAEQHEKFRMKGNQDIDTHQVKRAKLADNMSESIAEYYEANRVLTADNFLMSIVIGDNHVIQLRQALFDMQGYMVEIVKNISDVLDQKVKANEIQGKIKKYVYDLEVEMKKCYLALSNSSTFPSSV